jgi:plastocyanin
LQAHLASSSAFTTPKKHSQSIQSPNTLITYTFNMLFSTIVYGALAHAMAASAATMVVTVAANNKFVFTPNTITAQPGDMVAFNFLSQVCFSSFDVSNSEH